MEATDWESLLDDEAEGNLLLGRPNVPVVFLRLRADGHRKHADSVLEGLFGSVRVWVVRVNRPTQCGGWVQSQPPAVVANPTSQILRLQVERIRPQHDLPACTRFQRFAGFQDQLEIQVGIEPSQPINGRTRDGARQYT